MGLETYYGEEIPKNSSSTYLTLSTYSPGARENVTFKD
jgi:hypothetical protein